jgi:hypothetical protein
MTDTMKLVLLRHGESLWNKENLFTGWTDVDLSETGRAEALAAGRTMKAEGFDFDICFTSYLKRAIHTLNGALSEMDREWLPVIKTWKLNERHYGALQGLNKAETTEKYGEEYVKNYVAVPGYSEHHTGLALDLYFTIGDKTVYENEDLVQYPEIWAAIHEKLPEYGFILRFPEGKEKITGVSYEPWHLRYIDSPETAKEITEKGITLEEYLADKK